uniref:Small EDRK-rich factor-like N-terminal domain-containing protein n=1 Tax=Corethrella appendiculata TaxID=1370023 RepID=U5EW05_9DIPT
MTRGNQRELARAKNNKKNADKSQKKDDGLTVEQRKFRDAELMRQKQKQKEDAAAAGASNQSTAKAR